MNAFVESPVFEVCGALIVLAVFVALIVTVFCSDQPV